MLMCKADNDLSFVWIARSLHALIKDKAVSTDLILCSITALSGEDLKSARLGAAASPAIGKMRLLQSMHQPLTISAYTHKKVLACFNDPGVSLILLREPFKIQRLFWI